MGSGAVVLGAGFGEAGVGGCWGGAVEGSVGAVVVVGAGEFVELGLEVGDGGCGGLGFEPFFEGLLESLDFAAGGGVVGLGVLLGDAEGGEAGLVGVAAAAAPCEACGAGPWRCR